MKGTGARTGEEPATASPSAMDGFSRQISRLLENGDKTVLRKMFTLRQQEHQGLLQVYFLPVYLRIKLKI